MEPDEEFIKTVVILAREEEKRENHHQDRNSYKYYSNTKQLFKKYTLDDPSRAVSWLLFLMVKGTFTFIKDKAVKLLDRLLIKQREDYIGYLSDTIINTAKVETIKLLDSTLSNTFRQHLFNIIESFAMYLAPRGLWDELEQSLEDIVKGGVEGLPLLDNTRALIQVLSKGNPSKVNTLMTHYCEHGGEIAISTFPRIIPTIIDCLNLNNDANIRLFASNALVMAAQVAKDSFSPWVIDVLTALETMVSSPHALSEINETVTKNAISKGSSRL
ncbi:hypothetical protein DFA_00476 [Cavenderia fasciculata]|uniref:Uncharacterized protein n=1 Tax=Cavenderia fasciculata TaxID=261658 RepID=F4PS17_CACFS|nr:uncharacterized protein DFA_00476 [Cavenderia fasciculata]EGG20615.1 hypothetical protein DFA_00476 [Cavenderia fasciculata]|eukprot:XP_004358465.1 hypothetical protein DFA_00476 [Cavenderia fasciculata]